jgi:two-component system sensor histidine kinase VicK
MDEKRQSEKIAQLESKIKQLETEISDCEKLNEKNRILEDKHNRSQLRFKTIFEKSQLGNKILGEDLSILEVNEAFINLLGFDSKKDIINRRVVEFAHPDFIKHWHDLQAALWQEKISTFSLDTCLIKKDGTVIWCHVTSILFEDEGRTLGYTILENINERKVLELKAERLYKAQEIVVNMVAHDLKSPLNTIQQLSAIIRENVNNQEMDEALLHLSLLDKTCNRNDVIINDLLFIGELELEDGPLQKQVVDVVEIARTVVEQKSLVAQQKNIQLNCDFSHPKIFAQVNKEKVSRVLENLLSNAIKFTKTGGVIDIKVSEEQSDLLIKIQDSGIGIPEAMQETIFNKFTKAKRKGTEGEQTTGLGLFIAKRIVELHGGEIWFESKPDVGTTFFIRIQVSE